MLFIALLVLAAVAMGAVLGEDKRANIVPHDIQNTICIVSTDSTDDSGFGATTNGIDEAMKQLGGRPGLCSLDPGGDNCQNLYCGQNTSVQWCNDDTIDTITKNCTELSPYVWHIKYDCVTNSSITEVWGRVIDTDGFYVEVSGDLDCA
ncbi:hypothetical protein PG996_011089 [Apiospora saccharicola]|uniref:Uncharacterized protein n=1 Tax=Apiospora saccharicola TaxID=335842 RepID=A0ABR1UE18_9PEZI